MTDNINTHRSYHDRQKKIDFTDWHNAEIVSINVLKLFLEMIF